MLNEWYLREGTVSRWCKDIELTQEQLDRLDALKGRTGHRKNILYQGTIQVVVGNKNLLYKILGWIEGFSQKTAPFLASVAQSVEQLPLKEKVPSSILGGGTIFSE